LEKGIRHVHLAIYQRPARLRLFLREVWAKAIIMKQTARGIWKVAFSPSDIVGGYGFPVEESKIREVHATCGAAWLQD